MFSNGKVHTLRYWRRKVCLMIMFISSFFNLFNDFLHFINTDKQFNYFYLFTCRPRADYVQIKSRLCADQEQTMCTLRANYVKTKSRLCVHQEQTMCRSRANYVYIKRRICANQEQTICTSRVVYVHIKSRLCAH